MQAISQNDYYTLFQTGLYIALEELRVTQAHLAEVCGISAGYLSKLKGWQVFKPGDTLVAKPHVTNTNFRNYAVPLLEFLQAEHGIGFAEGFFAHAGQNTEPRQWGDIGVPSLPAPPGQTPLPIEPSVILDDPDIPENGEISIEWTIDPTDEKNLQALLEKMRNLAQRANAKMTVKVVLRKSMEPPGKILHQRNMNVGFQHYFSFGSALQNLRKNRFFDVRMGDPGFGGDFTELVSVKNALTGRKSEQFCDYSHWQHLTRVGEWDFFPEKSLFRSQGLYQYLLSRYDYGAQPFTIKAVLAFNGYAQHAGAHSQTANAGLILGWKQTAAQPPQYYHILLDGSRMLLERVGALSGNDYLAFEHLDTGVPFRVEDGLEYHFSVHVTPRYISVFVNNHLRYQVASPPDIEGLVGIRPWRAAVACRYFEVGED